MDPMCVKRNHSFLWSNNRQYGGSMMGRRGESIFRRKDGRWEARYLLGKDAATGKAKYRSVYGNTYSEAKEKRMQAMTKTYNLDFRIEPGQFQQHRPRGRPGGEERKRLAVVTVVVGIPFGAPVLCTPGIPRGRPEHMKIPKRSLADLPGLFVNILPFFEERFFPILRDVEKICLSGFLPERVDFREGAVGFETVRRAGPGFNIQFGRHGEDLVEVDAAIAVFIVLDCFQHSPDRFRIAAECENVCYMVRHLFSFPTPVASILLMQAPNAEMTGTLTALPAIL